MMCYALYTCIHSSLCFSLVPENKEGNKQKKKQGKNILHACMHNIIVMISIMYMMKFQNKTFDTEC